MFSIISTYKLTDFNITRTMYILYTDTKTYRRLSELESFKNKAKLLGAGHKRRPHKIAKN